MKLKDLAQDAVFQVESAKLDFALEIRKSMVRNGLTNAAVAERMDVSRPLITKILRGDSNVTIDTMVRTSLAAGGKLFVKVVRDGSTARFFEVVEKTMTQERWQQPVPAKGMKCASRQVGGLRWSIACNDDSHEAQPSAA